MKILVLALLTLLLGGCFNAPTKDDAKEIATVSATALGESVTKQVAIEIKKGLEEGGFSKEKLAEISKTIADKASESVLISLETHLRNKQQQAEKNGEPSPAWVGLALFALKTIHDLKRDGFIKKTPIDVNGDGKIDEKDIQAT